MSLSDQAAAAREGQGREAGADVREARLGSTEGSLGGRLGQGLGQRESSTRSLGTGLGLCTGRGEHGRYQRECWGGRSRSNVRGVDLDLQTYHKS